MIVYICNYLSFVVPHNQAKEILIELHDNPQKINSTKSKFIQIKDGLDSCIQIWSSNINKDL